VIPLKRPLFFSGGLSGPLSPNQKTTDSPLVF
jgi:hypothetical protein